MDSVLPLALLVAGIGACLYLFWTLKMEMRRNQKSQAAQAERLESAIASLTRDLEELRRQLKERPLEQIPSAPPSAINLSKRAQALRMHRRGEPAATIAAALSIPQNEVELLLKLDRMQSED